MYSYDKMILLDPNESWSWKLKGDCFKELKRYDEAMKWLNIEKIYFFFIVMIRGFNYIQMIIRVRDIKVIA